VIAGKHYVPLVYFLFLGFYLSGSIELPNVSIRFYKSEELTRIPEYFSGKEFTGSRIFSRTNDDKEGLYFSFPIDPKITNASVQLKALISVIRSDRQEPVEYEFVIPEDRTGKKEMFLGITGKDWTLKKSKVLAWRIELKNGQDELLFLKKSFLWDHN
jgi:hypothetical protein